MRVRLVPLMRLARLPELLRAGVEAAVDPDEIALARAELRHAAAQRRAVGRLHRSEAAIAAAVVGGADRSTAGVRHRTKARRAVRDGHADGAAALALDADAVRAHARAP